MEITSTILFAERTRIDTFSEGFRSRGSSGRDDVLLGLLIVATLIAGIWAISRLLSLRRKRRGCNDPRKLFWALAKAHKLNWSDTWLLRRVAREQGLRDPGRLFLEADRWDEKNLGPRFALEVHRLKALRNQLLGEPQLANPFPEPPIRPARRVPAAAPPILFPGLPSPTLDVPPWTADR